MSDGSGSRPGRKQRSGYVACIAFLRSAFSRGGSPDSAATTEPAHRGTPRRRISLRGLLSRPLIVVGIVIVVAGGSIGAWAVTRSTASTKPSYRLFPAVRTTLRQTLATGTIEPTTTDTLSFGASGQVTSVYAAVGQRVTEGQNLATMESASLQAQVAQAQATLAEDQSRLSQDETAVASSAQIAADQATVNADQSQVESAEAALSGATLTSPIDGIVATVGLTVGEQVSGGSGGSGASGLGSGGSAGTGTELDRDGEARRSSSSSSRQVGHLDQLLRGERDRGRHRGRSVQAGDQAVIVPDGATGPVYGVVNSVGLIASTTSGVASYPVTIAVTGNPGGLYPGASATVTLVVKQIATRPPCRPPRHSTSGGAEVHVMVNGHQVTVPVTMGITSTGETQIITGLTAGPRVVGTARHRPRDDRRDRPAGPRRVRRRRARGAGSAAAGSGGLP